MTGSSASTGTLDNTLREILNRLERIESKIDENYYPPEDSIRGEFIEETEAIRKEIEAGHFPKCKTAKDLFSGTTNE
ncbi:hypothetical protein [Methanolacinia petrolearia]|uniref:hypothetical protein n=1 Tax=Methanolacinia petrolearia TaxID=54120 RepID=UPI003BA981EE